MDIFYGEDHQKQPLNLKGIEVAQNIVDTHRYVLINFTVAEDLAMAKLQRMANNPDPQEHPSESDMELLDFYNKYSD